MAFFADMLSSARETIEPISVALTGRSASSSPGNSAVLFETLSISRMIPSRPSGQLANGSRSPKAAVVASEGSSPHTPGMQLRCDLSGDQGKPGKPGHRGRADDQWTRCSELLVSSRKRSSRQPELSQARPSDSQRGGRAQAHSRQLPVALGPSVQRLGCRQRSLPKTLFPNPIYLRRFSSE